MNHCIMYTGPVDPYLPDFWRMVWEQKSTLIIMMANVMEGGKVDKILMFYKMSFDTHE